MKKYDEKDTACNKSIFVACERATMREDTKNKICKFREI